MSLQQEVEMLRNIPLFANIEASKLKLIAFTAERLTYQPEDVLFNQGDMGDAAYIIMEGEVDILVNGPSGPFRVATLGSNEIVGEIAILCDEPRNASVKANTELTTLCINRDLFFRLVCEFPQIGVELMRELAYRVAKTTTQLTDTKQKLDEATKKLETAGTKG